MDAWPVIRGLAILIFLFFAQLYSMTNEAEGKEWMHGM